MDRGSDHMTHRNYSLTHCLYRDAPPSWRQRRADALVTLLLGAIVAFVSVMVLVALGALAP